MHAQGLGVRRLRASVFVAAALAAMGLASAALAQSAGGDFSVTKSVIAAGSANASGGDFSLAGTVGQHDAGKMQGGDFTAYGGFWPAGEPAAPGGTGIFANGFE